MHRIIFLLSAMVALWGCASRTTGPQDPILGTWNGVGMLSGMEMRFQPDNTYSMDGKVLGKWSKDGDRYIIHLSDSGEEVRRTGEIDKKGRLVMSEDERLAPNLKFVFQKAGAGAEQPIPAGEMPKGEWRFAYTSKSSIPAASPAPFDIMTFGEGGQLVVKSSVAGKEYNLHCRISNGTISLSESEGKPVALEMSFRWEKPGERLVLGTPHSDAGGVGGMEWMMLRPQDFAADSIEGTYVTEWMEEGWMEEIKFDASGLCYRTVKDKAGRVIKPVHPEFNDYYRVWTAPFGTAVTIVTFVPDMSSQASVVFKCEKDPAGLAMTPVELERNGTLKPLPADRAVWKKQ